jgi:hypothetical protein
VIANHQSYTDSLVISGIALRYGMLAHIKYFAKESLKWIPILGKPSNSPFPSPTTHIKQRLVSLQI